MLKHIKITDLFNIEDVSIDFNKRSVIITGDNGNGKTTILNIVYNLLVGNIDSLLINDFSNVQLIFEDDFEILDEIIIKKIYNHVKKIEEVDIQYFFDKEILNVKLSVYRGQKRVVIKSIQSFFRGKNKDINHILTEVLDYTGATIIELLEELGESKFSDKLKKINESLLYFPTYRRIDIDIDSYYANLFKGPAYHYITRQQHDIKGQFGINDRRVIGMNNSDIQNILQDYSSSINEEMSKNLDVLLHSFTKNTILEAENSPTSIEINKLFNINIFEQLKDINSKLNLNIEEERLTKISEQYKGSVNFLKKVKDQKKPQEDDAQKFFDIILSVPLLKVLYNLQESYSDYTNKMEEILASYRYISESLDDFSGNKLKLFRTDSNEFGFTKVGTDITSFSDFSTGEKQLITFLVYTTIKLPKHSPALVIIDEPELSLHVKWQNKLLKNLLKKENIKVLSATHSPYIINRKEVDSSVVRKGEVNGA